MHYNMIIFIFVQRIVMSQIVLYFLHSTYVLSFQIDLDWALSIGESTEGRQRVIVLNAVTLDVCRLQLASHISCCGRSSSSI